MPSTRRDFLLTSGAATLAFLGLRSLLDGAVLAGDAGYGPLVPDPNKLLDLPQGFSYVAFSRAGEEMTDGLLVPGAHDGMAAFPGPDGKTILIRNHELSIETGLKRAAYGADLGRLGKVPKEKFFDYGKGLIPSPGGTTTLLYDTGKQKLDAHWLSLAGTIRNCAGGPTPWNSWLSCEEVVLLAKGNVEQNHGYIFEVPVTDKPALADPVPLKAMGRFFHEAIAVDPKSGVVYETEDREDGLLYRFIPRTPGKFAEGGRLQMLAAKGKKSLDTRNWEPARAVEPGQPLEVEWLDIAEPDALDDGLRRRGFAAGAARFARGEGMWYGRDAVYFCCTSGGKRRKGQVWRYVPSPAEGKPGEAAQPGKLELFVEPDDPSILDMCDNLTVAPWGDLVLCEDGPDENGLVVVTQDGKLFRLARNVNGTEMAGACFSPDGGTLFVNSYGPGTTFAIAGPWKK